MAVVEKRQIKDFDWLTALLAVAIVCFGVLQIYNAKPEETFWSKQLLGLFIAIVAMLAVAFSDYRKLVDMAPIFYVIGLVLLLLVLIPGLGVKINGQRAWIQIPAVGRFQPSEFMKIPVVLMLARYFGNRKLGYLKLHEIAIGAGIVALPISLIMLEPDAGQSITYFPLLAVVLFLSGIKMRYVVITILAAAIFVPASYVVGTQTGLIKGYQQERIEVILDPENADPRGYGYHTFQSIITVGKGQVTGIKDKQLSQSQLKFLPEPHSDFIFAVTAENTGFVGCISLLLAYALLISRLVAGARQSPDRIGMLVIMSFVGGMIVQIFMNLGMVLGFLPVIGVPLPLMSAGVSSVLSNFIAIGFVISVKMRRFVN
ncbi:MAG: FtsW/RodA/SpoVE family cell cycle protein [Pyrinomonadaceae bacterium]